MTGMSDVRLKLYPQELQGTQFQQRYSPPAGMGYWQLFMHRWSTRRELLELSDEQLYDIGLTPTQARREGLKPFWRK